MRRCGGPRPRELEELGRMVYFGHANLWQWAVRAPPGVLAHDFRLVQNSSVGIAVDSGGRVWRAFGTSTIHEEGETQIVRAGQANVEGRHDRKRHKTGFLYLNPWSTALDSRVVAAAGIDRLISGGGSAGVAAEFEAGDSPQLNYPFRFSDLVTASGIWTTASMRVRQLEHRIHEAESQFQK